MLAEPREASTRVAEDAEEKVVFALVYFHICLRALIYLSLSKPSAGVPNERSILSEGRGGWGDVVDGIALASLVG